MAVENGADAIPGRRPALRRIEQNGLAVWLDRGLLRDRALLVAFTERRGGVSAGPYSSLNLAAHVGDRPEAVDENRRLVLEMLGMGSSAALTCVEQVHGTEVAVVRESEVGRGATSRGRPPLPGADAIISVLPGVPVGLFFADCVPVVLVADSCGSRAVAVVHAGWRGALGRLPGKTALRLAEEASCATSDLLAYIGPHICPTHYRVGWEVLSQFADSFDTIAAAPEARGRPGPLDLGMAVSESLSEVGVPPRNILHAGLCTYESEDAFFSYRRAATTGRQSALACVMEEGR